ncbi:apoptosis-associated speck-like protein containing a CARD [Hyla sarda]|uniref:apoptosis-associated speck-like protein containing a CARD n=1 Tax=Hyla sarda TaxID=327740 RepID=UPI0024C431FF|nr:apoptosis-associated speck-like protein containing a CARD [Hyla sarda]XP_056392813.1 apoptosis-associated speck-like protein containing a CARD [Hyla sarda]
MGKTVRGVLVQSLSNLEKKSLKKFRRNLNEFKIKKEYNRIPKGELEEADPDDITDLIRRYYKDDYGVKVTLAVLEAIDELEEAETLRRDLQEVVGWAPQEATNGADEGAPSREGTEEAAQGTTSGDEQHFVDKYRTELIERVVLVSPILDDLYSLLKGEPYNTVRSMKTSHEQMRALLSHVESWGKEDKDKFRQSLFKHNAPLVRDLERK